MRRKESVAMLSTVILLKFFGLVSSVFGLAFLTNKKLLVGLIEDLGKSKAIQFLFALAPLALGSYLVAAHNLWGDTRQTVVTLIGWLLFMGGCYRVLFMNQWVRIALKLKKDLPYLLIGCCQLTFGIVCLYFGYFTN